MDNKRFSMVKSHPSKPDYIQPEEQTKPLYIRLAEKYASEQGMDHCPWWMIDLFKERANRK